MKLASLLLLLLTALPAMADGADSTTFKGYLYNAEYQVYIDMDFYGSSVLVPQQEIFGELPGYFGAVRDNRKWPFTDAEITGPGTARLEITNDYGSEDLVATLSLNENGTYTLKQESGSTLKIAVNRKWVKIPKTLVFERRTERVPTPFD